LYAFTVREDAVRGNPRGLKAGKKHPTRTAMNIT